MRTGWIKALAVVPGLVVSTVLIVIVGAVLPGPVGLAVFVGGTACVGLLAAGRGERAAARLLCHSRPVTGTERAVLAPAITLLCRQGLGPPLTDIRVRTYSTDISADPLGRRTLIVSSGLVDAVREDDLASEEAAAGMVHAAALVHAGMARSDAVIAFWSLPWRLVRGVAAVVAAVFRPIPLTAAVWRLRGVVAAVATVQVALDGYFGIGVVIAAVTVVSYGMPVWERQWDARLERIGDREVVARGMGPALAGFLRRCPATPQGHDRLDRLESPRHRPAMGLVRGSR